MTLPRSALLLVPLLAGLPAQAFDMDELKGLWAESTQSRFACTSTNRYQRFELSADNKHLLIKSQHGPGGPAASNYELDIIRREKHSLFLQFPGHSDPADPLSGEWALTMLGPGVYRWHLAQEHEGLKPAPIGVRCAA
jgi:hypothetical protein